MSWAVPKGPTLDSTIRRMAVHVEDHPIEYFDFEGVIPAKQYGSGDVIVWDWGTWEPEAPTLDPRKAVADGELKFRLHGEKLKGRFTIVRTSAPARRGDPSTRLRGRPGRAVAAHPQEGRDLAARLGRRGPPAERQDRPDERRGQGRPRRPLEWQGAGRDRRDRPGRRRDRAAPRPHRPDARDPRLEAVRRPGLAVRDQVGRLSRPGGRHRRQGPHLDPQPPRRRDVLPAPAHAAVLDRRPRGDRRRRGRGASTTTGDRTSRCSRTRLGEKGATGLVYQAFDLLYLDGRSLLDVPLEDRKRLLKSVLRDHPRVRFAAHVEGEGKAFFAAAQASRLEGVIAKLRRSRYEPGRRSNAWLKLKIRPEQELVVGGWTPGRGERARPRGAGGRRLRGRQAAVRRQGRVRVHRRAPQGPAGAAQAARRSTSRRSTRAPPKDYRGRWGGDLARHHLGPAGARDPGRAGRLVARRRWSARRRSRASRRAATRSTVARETAVATTTAVKAAEAEAPPMPKEPSKPKSAASKAADRPPRSRPGAPKSKASALEPRRPTSPRVLARHRRRARGARRARARRAPGASGRTS